MITRTRGRADEQQKAEVRSPSPSHTDADAGEWVDTTDQLHATSSLQSSPEGENGSGLDLDDFFCFDGLHWSLDENALSPLFEAGVAASSDADSLGKRDRTDPPPENGEQHSSLNTKCTIQKPQKLEKILPSQINKNAIAARMNRLKKKEYLNGLEKKVGALVSENCSLKEENSNLIKRVEELEGETRYLRAVLANESMLAQLLSRLSGVNGMKLSTSLFQEADKNDHDYALPRKRVKVEEKETSGGICLHVDKNHVSVEFCTKCAESASTTFKM